MEDIIYKKIRNLSDKSSVAKTKKLYTKRMKRKEDMFFKLVLYCIVSCPINII